MTLHAYILDATLTNIRYSLKRHMPASPQRDFYLWGISPSNPHQKTFLQTMGVLQVVNLGAALLEDLIDPGDWKQLSSYIGKLNTYFMFEIISDDLAIGLSPFAIGDAAFPLRREILYAFNYVMVDRLKGENIPTIELMQPLEHFIRFVSGFTQSLTPAKHQDILNAYLAVTQDASAEAIEYGIWPLLVANIDACRVVTDTMSPLYTGDMLRQGLINRYMSVTTLLEGDEMPRDCHLALGTWTILVAPTLTFYVGAVAEILYPNDDFASVIEDNLLEDAIYTAAQLVRLLNDMGGLVMATAEKREEIINLLSWRYHQNPDQYASITELLYDTAGELEIMARIFKDVSHGEFNICLNNLTQADMIPEAIAVFAENLEYFSQIYFEKQNELEYLLDTVTQRLGDHKVSTIIKRFVQFHQKVYANRYTSPIGEYSI